MPGEIVEQRVGRFLVGTCESFSAAVYAQITSLFTRAQDARRGGVVAPHGITRQSVEGIGRVVVKHYLRGGLLRFFLHRSYLHWGEYRSKHEFLMLARVRQLGISAPRPIAYGIEGGIFYRTWLVLSELEGVTALADLALDRDPARYEQAMEQLAVQVERMIENGVFHVDLHPGNVVIDGNDQLFILDFDKARMFSGPLNELRDRYLRRWRRSVIKHNLPESFSELFCARLRKRYAASCQNGERVVS